MIKIYSKVGIGSGFICKINDNQLNFKYALFMNNHALGEEELQKGEKILFEYKNELKYIKLDDDRKFFTDKDIDYTCIEIKESDNFQRLFFN
jgi:hypothetical protein